VARTAGERRYNSQNYGVLLLYIDGVWLGLNGDFTRQHCVAGVYPKFNTK